MIPNPKSFVIKFQWFFVCCLFISLQSYLLHECVCMWVIQSDICMMYGRVSMAFCFRNQVFVFKRAFACASEYVLFCKRSQCFVCVFLFFGCLLPRTTHFAKWMVCVCLCMFVCVVSSWLGTIRISAFFLSNFLFYFITCCCCCGCCSWVYNGWRYSSESTRLTDTKSMIY